MSTDLSQRVRGVLQRVLIELTQGKSVSRSAQQSTMRELRIWCEEHGLETQPWYWVKTVSVDRPILARI